MYELIKRARLRHIMMGQHPTKITMTQRMKDQLDWELIQHNEVLFSQESEDREILGLKIEVRNDLDYGVMFIIS